MVLIVVFCIWILQNSNKKFVNSTLARVWRELFSSGRYKDPSLAQKKHPMIHPVSQ